MARRAKHETDDIEGEFVQDGCEGCKVILDVETPAAAGISVSMSFLDKIPEIDTRGRCETDSFGDCGAVRGCYPVVKLKVINNTASAVDCEMSGHTADGTDYSTINTGQYRTYVTAGYINEAVSGDGNSGHGTGFGYSCGDPAFNHGVVHVTTTSEPVTTLYKAFLDCGPCVDSGDV